MTDLIIKAIEILRAGGLIALPTETVYGLGADASNPFALQKIFLAKQRPLQHPLIVHLADISQLTTWAREVPETAYLLAEAFWPGPLALILKKAAQVHEFITGGQDTIGLRIPNHPIALAVLKNFGQGIAAPSANRFGRISPTTAQAVREELGSAVDLILEGGQCNVGVESTIVNLTSEQPVILRPGMITADEIAAVLHQPVSLMQTDAPRVSGSCHSHYAPTTETCLMSREALNTFLQENRNSTERFAIVSRGEFFAAADHFVFVKMSSQPEIYAHDLYAVLRKLDYGNFKRIIVEAVPNDSQWIAIHDRLQRASHAR